MPLPWTRFSVAAVICVSGTLRAADFSWTNAAGGNWNVAGNWSPGGGPPTNLTDNATLGTLAGSYTVQLTDSRSVNNLTIGSASATLIVTGGLTVGGMLAVNSGTFNLNSGLLTLNGSMTTGAMANANWTGGTIAGSGTLAGVLVASGGTKSISGASLQNSGTLRWTSGSISNASLGTVLTNIAGGLIDFQADNTAFVNVPINGAGTLVNQGTIRKSAGSASATSIEWAVRLQNLGVLDGQVGVLNLDGGGILGNGTTAISGAGRVSLNGGIFTVPTGDVFTAQGSGGSNLNWTGGTLTADAAGPGTLAGVLIAAGGAKSISGANLQSGGQLRWTSGSISNASLGTVLTNVAGGLIDLQADSAAFVNVPINGAGTLNNLGTIRKSAGTATNTSIAWTVTNAGLVENSVPGILNLTSGVATTNTGIFTMVNGATIGGNIVSNANGSVRGPAAGSGTYTGQLTFNSGSTLFPGAGQPGGLVISNNLAMNSGSTFFERIVNGTPVTGYSRISVAGNVSLNGATLAGDTTGFSPSGSELVFILLNNGVNPISGTFAGAPQGGTVTLGGYNATISYVGNFATMSTIGGRDVVLYQFTPVPEPTLILGTVLGATSAYYFRRRLRK